MSDGYTPTTDEVRAHYCGGARMRKSVEFDRWLAEVERAAAEKAWDEAVAMCCRMFGARNVNWPNPYRADRLAADGT